MYMNAPVAIVDLNLAMGRVETDDIYVPKVLCYRLPRLFNKQESIPSHYQMV